MFWRNVLLFSVLTVPTLAAAESGGGGTPYFEIPTPFVVNLADNDSLNFLQVNAQLKVAREDLKQHLSKHMPAIQHTVMMVLSEQSAGDVKSVAGKQKLRETTLKELQSLLQQQVGDPAVTEIYFTGFIIQ
jgi:flagellar FliL protein